MSADGAILQDSPPVRCRYCCPHVLHHSPGSPRYTFASVEPNQKEYVGYYRLLSLRLAALQSDVVESRKVKRGNSDANLYYL